jgi:NAD(P)-dependent dehydrogenase (short-subunit alcohol dehydrogenase family)
VIVAHAIKSFGKLDIVMNNAGISGSVLVEVMTEELWDRVLNVNLSAQFKLCQRAIPYLKQSPAGRIINVASVMAEGTDYGLAAYCASKAGVAGLTRTLAWNLASHDHRELSRARRNPDRDDQACGTHGLTSHLGQEVGVALA